MMASTNSEENDHERPSKRQDTGRDKDEKLTKLATGAEWKPGDPNLDKCFVCDLANELLNCEHCSRSYHSKCLDPPLNHDSVPESWACPACALLGVKGATHTYVLDQRQDATRMTRIESSSSTAVCHSERSDELNPVGDPQRPKSESTAQSNSAQRVRPRSPARTTSSENRSLWVKSYHSEAPQNTIKFGFTGRRGRPPIIDLDFLERSRRISADSNGTLNNPSVPARSVENTPTHPDQSELKRGRPSRYSTLPDEVDEALATINRQLEDGLHYKKILEHVTARNKALEQELKIERGKALLATRNEQAVGEVEILREEIQRLKRNAERDGKKIRDLEGWKLRMKAMIDGDGV